MTRDDKLFAFEQLLRPERAEESLMEALLDSAGELILNRMYPFGWADGTEIPHRYEQLQLRIAMELYAKRGAEGETSRTENVTQRVYESAGVSPSLLNQIMPCCSGVIRS